MAKFEARDGELYIDGKRVLKGWETYNGIYHFATEDLGEQEFIIDGKEVKGREYHGFVQMFEDEWGPFTDAEFVPLIAAGKMWEIKKCDLPYAGRR